MAEGNDPVIVDIMNSLEAQPDSSSSVKTTATPHPNFPALRGRLSILVSTGFYRRRQRSHRRAAHTGAREAINCKDVEKYT